MERASRVPSYIDPRTQSSSSLSSPANTPTPKSAPRSANPTTSSLLNLKGVSSRSTASKSLEQNSQARSLFFKSHDLLAYMMKVGRFSGREIATFEQVSKAWQRAARLPNLRMTRYLEIPSYLRKLSHLTLLGMPNDAMSLKKLADALADRGIAAALRKYLYSEEKAFVIQKLFKIKPQVISQVNRLLGESKIDGVADLVKAGLLPSGAEKIKMNSKKVNYLISDDVLLGLLDAVAHGSTPTIDDVKAFSKLSNQAIPLGLTVMRDPYGEKEQLIQKDITKLKEALSDDPETSLFRRSGTNNIMSAQEKRGAAHLLFMARDTSSGSPLFHNNEISNDGLSYILPLLPSYLVDVANYDGHTILSVNLEPESYEHYSRYKPLSRDGLKEKIKRIEVILKWVPENLIDQAGRDGRTAAYHAAFLCSRHDIKDPLSLEILKCLLKKGANPQKLKEKLDSDWEGCPGYRTGCPTFGMHRPREFAEVEQYLDRAVRDLQDKNILVVPDEYKYGVIQQKEKHESARYTKKHGFWLELE